jgi:hypothetical protein
MRGTKTEGESMKPTPGPWRAVGGAIRPESAKGYTGGYAPILAAHHDKRLPDNREANAKLAAAAPELLESLQWLMRQVPEPSLPGDYTTGYLAAKAAIHKATGSFK